MHEEDDVLRITEDDITQANQLSLACPICAGPVENMPLESELQPVRCVDCDTLYHHACWEQNGGKCAILGCTSTQVLAHGALAETLTITLNEVPTDAQVGRQQQRLKNIERERMRRAGKQPQPVNSGFWAGLFRNIAKAFGFNRPR